MFIKQTHQKQKPRSSLITQLTTLSLALILSITSLPATQLTVYADPLSDNPNNQGGGSGEGKGAVSADLTWDEFQGYRIYVVNADLIRISPTYDFMYKAPAYGEAIFTTRYDGSISPNEHHAYYMKTLQEWCNSSDDVPPPTKKVNDVRQGNGGEFKNWFFAGQAGTTIYIPNNPDDPLGTGGSSGGTGGSSGGTGGSSGGTGSSGGGIGSYGGSGMNTEEIIGTNPVTPEIANYITQANAVTTTAREKAQLAWESFTDEEKRWIGNRLQANNDIFLEAINIYNYYELDKATAFRAAVSRTYYNLEETFGWKVASFVIDSSYNSAYNKFMGGYSKTALYMPYNAQSLLSTNIPLAGETNSGLSPASHLVNKPNTLKCVGYETPAEAIQDGGYLVVEPLINMKIRTSTGDWESSDNYTPYRVYGTYWNIASRWIGGGGAFNTPMTIWFNNCMVTTNLLTTSTGKTIKPITNYNSQKTMDESKRLMADGYGLSMHIYDAGDFNQAATHTWDSITHPKDPGPAPDPSPLPDETEYAEKSKIVTIIKNYVEIKNGTEITIGNYTRTLNPHQIAIEDEPQYKVVAWNTSITTPPTIPDGNKTPWREVISNSTQTQQGINPTIVKLDEEEIVLYVKLQRITYQIS